MSDGDGGGLTLKCPFCGRLCKNINGLKVHVAMNHKKVAHCIYCNKRFKRFSGLMKHIANMADEKHIALGVLLQGANARFIRSLKRANGYDIQYYYNLIREYFGAGKH
ncbi:MAG: hypothetical protein DRJ60_00465 [Thermoprotei archaeon]|nr:MAG: hypothetical protein DRJ60_00465 [Thermoprotei archaeon]